MRQQLSEAFFFFAILWMVYAFVTPWFAAPALVADTAFLAMGIWAVWFVVTTVRNRYGSARKD
jgi:hypothetical protein